MSSETQAAPKMSLGARLMNVLATPDEVFETVQAGRPSTGNWLAPLLLACVVGVLFNAVAYTQPAIVQQLRDEQDQKIEKMVKSGAITASQAESTSEEMDRFFGPDFYILTRSFKAVGMSLAQVFLVAMIAWFIGVKWYDGRFSFMQMVEVNGLATMILVWGTVVTMFLVVAKGNLGVTLGPVLLVKEMNPANKVHALLAVLSAPTLWYLGVLARGLARLSGARPAGTAAWLFGLWMVYGLASALAPSGNAGR